ncbi:MAG: 2,4-dihydroxyhept-2-ene-1,7-dioic acid aldolase [Chloroflexi bacterium]|nr:2,4-dihydroxyhept-2-ene-1,7-dioic acid aldolase [Chloroflexota bacterium]
MRKNRLRELIREGKPSIGTHAAIDDPAIIELIGNSGMFDYVEFVAEYGAYDLHSLDNIGRAIDLFPNFSGMIKVEQEPRTFVTIRAIGAGIQNLLFADIRTPADAAASVRAVRAEAPGSGGIHGVGMRRDAGYVLEVGTKPWIKALDEAVICLMIEKKECVENLDAVLSVPGIDMVQFGPSDYSMSIGVAEEYHGKRHDAVVEAENFIIETALKKGIRPRVELLNPADAAPYIEKGVKDFCIGWDVVILHTYYKTAGAQMRGMLGLDVPDWPAGAPFRN